MHIYVYRNTYTLQSYIDKNSLRECVGGYINIYKHVTHCLSLCVCVCVNGNCYDCSGYCCRAYVLCQHSTHVDI